MSTRVAGVQLSREDQVAGALLIFVVLTLVAAALSWPTALQFFLAVLAVLPLAALIGTATEALADRVGGKIGGLLNATFGNAPDLLVGVFGVQRGLIPLVKATLVGALISNSALIMGLCFMVAGLRFGRPRFKRQEAGHHSVLMMLTLAAILFPSAGAWVLCGAMRCSGTAHNDQLLHVSVGIAIALLLAYIAYVLYGIFGLESLARVEPEGRDEHVFRQRADGHTEAHWPTWFAVTALVGATVALIPVTDILTGSVEAVTSTLGWSQVFVGIILVANAGNVAEGYAAIRLAFQRGGEDPGVTDSGLDLSLGIASASSIQIATFVAPLIVLYSLTGHHMNLAFSAVEVSILGLLVFMFTFIAQDGESNWLEGFHLIVLYLMAAVIFFGLPENVFGG